VECQVFGDDVGGAIEHGGPVDCEGFAAVFFEGDVGTDDGGEGLEEALDAHDIGREVLLL